MQTDPESLYLQFTQLIAEMPLLEGRGTHPPETYRWLGRAVQLVRAVGNDFDAINLSAASESLGNGLQMGEHRKISAIAFRALATAEARAPAATRGGFVAVGEGFTAIQVIGKVLSEAKTDVLIVDPYMGAKVFTDFALLAAAKLTVRLLGDDFYTKADLLKPFANRWGQQYGAERPLETRVSAPRALHDRLIILDDSLVYAVTQSFEHFAARSPALVQRIDPDLAKLKVEAYGAIWAGAKSVI